MSLGAVLNAPAQYLGGIASSIIGCLVDQNDDTSNETSYRVFTEVLIPTSFMVKLKTKCVEIARAHNRADGDACAGLLCILGLHGLSGMHFSLAAWMYRASLSFDTTATFSEADFDQAKKIYVSAFLSAAPKVTGLLSDKMLQMDRNAEKTTGARVSRVLG